jgi:hypothetical protein
LNTGDGCFGLLLVTVGLKMGNKSVRILEMVVLESWKLWIIKMVRGNIGDGYVRILVTDLLEYCR